VREQLHAICLLMQWPQPEVEGEVVCDWSTGEAGDPDEGILGVKGGEVDQGTGQGCGGGQVCLSVTSHLWTNLPSPSSLLDKLTSPTVV